MGYRIKVTGKSPIIQNNGRAGLDTSSAISREIAALAAKRGANKTEVDNLLLRELECRRSLWLDTNEQPTIPPSAIRATIENAARKTKQGPAVREGLVVLSTSNFTFDHDKYGNTIEEWGKNCQFTEVVVVQRARLLRTRAKFDNWSVEFELDTDDELIDKHHLDRWLDVAGRRIGLGDWRPQKSGTFGRFSHEFV